MSWTWRLESADGTAAVGVSAPPHASQSDAESWLGENWRELRETGVASVTLCNGDDVAYGPMSLSEE